jgi:RIP metalloprotease RseP
VNRVAELLMSQPPHEVALEVERAGQVLALTMTTTQERVLGEMRNGMDVVFVGLVGMDGLYVSPELLIAPWSRRISDAVYNGLSETVEFSSALVFMVGAMIGGQVDSSNFGGPIMMADAASRAAEAGWLALMRMAALLSVNLGIINLVPVPGLDGGHLLVLAVEGIRRRPLSNRTRQILNFVGIVSIVLLMLFAFKNDIERYWVDIAAWLNG